ncbi:MAG TPA: hypothetical protein VJS44_18580 [Pyrinomonadaceae bacterium]|nr:hypothetical protein [Pyrinomonadaceae bacterium]
MRVKNLRRVLIRICVVLASVLAAVLIIEAACRLLEIDLENSAAATRALPIYYRQPTEPVGEVFFRRPGPDVWKGNVLGVAYDKLWGAGNNPYLNEPEITVTYDRQGFRNPEDLTDWEIVVVGDSFTELGFLPFDELFTTRLGKLLGVRVKNLSVSDTSTLTQTFYLKEYGVSKSTSQSILVFFEGNDIEGIQQEAALLEEFKATGQRPYRVARKQTSFLKFLYHAAENAYVKARRRFARKQDAYYISKTGEIPVTLEHTPPGRGQLTPKQIELLDAALRQYAETARASGLTPWLVFMPSKIRAQYCCLRFTESTQPRFFNWRPTDLPELVEELSKKNGLRFINVTPALLKAASEGVLTFNPLWDTHLNREGSQVVAGAIAEELRRDGNSR